MARLQRTLIVAVLVLQLCLAKRFRHTDLKKYISENAVSEEEHPKIWALLVAGSNGWWNYRHQSDVCHAFHILRNHGIPEDRIVTMMYDDIADNKQNPYPGKIFNKPDGEDVYEGVIVDYSGKDVTPENFLAVLQGNKTAVKGGNGRVLESTGNDHVFVYFTDHGGVGLISFPFSILTVKDLNDALANMHKKKKYNQLVFYLEACESGSMFNKVLKKDIDVYAITAANEKESSWGCYCENDMKLPCLGDLFSVSWMDDSDEEDLSLETLKTQFDIVKEETNKSHVMHYGDLNIADEYVADFQGWSKGPLKKYGDGIHPLSAWPSRDVHLLSIKKQLKEAKHERQKKKLEHRVTKIETKRRYLENFMIDLVESLIHDPVNQRYILNNHPQAVTQLQCHDDVVKAFHRTCFHFSRNPYALKYVFVLTNLCEYGLETDIILEQMLQKCLEIELVGIY